MHVSTRFTTYIKHLQFIQACASDPHTSIKSFSLENHSIIASWLYK